jgi:hypothetical protein
MTATTTAQSAGADVIGPRSPPAQGPQAWTRATGEELPDSYNARYGPNEVRQARAWTAAAGRAWLTYQLAKG